VRKLGIMSQDLTGRSFEFARRVVKLCQALDRTPGVRACLQNHDAGTLVACHEEI
jgi:hypothetical protein